MKRAVFLDRDGVLNHAPVRDGRPYSPHRLEDFRILPDVPAALTRLKAAGYLLIVATNQPDVARGLMPRETLDAMHELLRVRLPLDDIRACIAEDGPDCDCYKPKPGLLLAAARDHGINLAESWMVGDRWRDVGAGRNAGCRTVFINYGYREPLPQAADYSVQSLTEAVGLIIPQPSGRIRQ